METITSQPTRQPNSVYRARYYANNKAKIFAHLSSRVMCPSCQVEYPLHYLSKHRKTKTHQKKLVVGG